MLTKDLMGLAMRETMSRPSLDRRPEPDIPPINEEDYRQAREASYRAFEPLHHFCSLAVSRLVPEVGTILDLGCGDAGFTTYLARRRPDVQIIAVESSQHLMKAAAERIVDQGVEEHIRLNYGSMTEFSERAPEQLDAIISVLSLHTLEDSEALYTCLQQISTVRMRTGCAVWLFDFSRPNSDKTAEEFAGTLMPAVPPTFRRECRDSLRASFTYQEVNEAIGHVSMGQLGHAQSTGIKIYQAHWIERGGKPVKSDHIWGDAALTTPSRQAFRNIAAMFPKVPLPPHVK